MINLTKAEIFLLNWLDQDEPSDYLECKGPALDLLKSRGLVHLRGAGNRMRVSLSTAGRIALDESAPDESVWTEWPGGTDPWQTPVLELERRDGEKFFARSAFVHWDHQDCPADVVRYRVVSAAETAAKGLSAAPLLENISHLMSDEQWLKAGGRDRDRTCDPHDVNVNQSDTTK